MAVGSRKDTQTLADATARMRREKTLDAMMAEVCRAVQEDVLTVDDRPRRNVSCFCGIFGVITPAPLQQQ